MNEQQQSFSFLPTVTAGKRAAITRRAGNLQWTAADLDTFCRRQFLADFENLNFRELEALERYLIARDSPSIDRARERDA